MKYSLFLGKVFGIKIYVHWTFALLIGWILIVSLRTGAGIGVVVWTLGFILAVFGCIVLHELGHSLMARKFQIETQSITLLPIGGVAQLEKMPEDPKQELLVALAGPAVNFTIALILLPFVNMTALLASESIGNIGGENFLLSIITVNIWLGLFNLLPAFPMDGGRVLRAALSFKLNRVKATGIALRIGQFFGLLFCLAGIFYSPNLAFIGLFIILTGHVENVSVKTIDFLHRYKVQDVVIKDIPSIEDNLSLKDASDFLLTTQDKNFVVIRNGMPVGSVCRDELAKGIREMGEMALVEKITNHDLRYFHETMPLDEAWKEMRHAKSSLALVGSKGKPVGMIDEDNIAELLLFKTITKSK